MKVRDVMTRDVITVRPQASLKEVAQIMVDRKISGAPVVGDDGGVIGVVSEADILAKERGSDDAKGGLLAWLLDPLTVDARLKLGARTAREAMSAPALTIEPGRPVHEAAARMLEEGINRLPVVEDGKLVGIVTRADLVRAFVRSDAEIAREIREDVLLRTLGITPETLNVAVESGEVRLAGHVGSKSDAELAAAFAGRVPGVVAVHSRLTWDEDDRRTR